MLTSQDFTCYCRRPLNMFNLFNIFKHHKEQQQQENHQHWQAAAAPAAAGCSQSADVSSSSGSFSSCCSELSTVSSSHSLEECKQSDIQATTGGEAANSADAAAAAAAAQEDVFAKAEFSNQVRAKFSSDLTAEYYPPSLVGDVHGAVLMHGRLEPIMAAMVAAAVSAPAALKLQQPAGQQRTAACKVQECQWVCCSRGQWVSLSCTLAQAH
jgi:hypothetical protein